MAGDVHQQTKAGGDGRVALRLGFANLSTRIIVSVFAAALVAGTAVTLIATSSTEAFLRAKIDERFPELLETAARNLDHWYGQRQVDVATFAASETVVQGIESRTKRSQRELQRYLAYVKEGFPQYEALFVLDGSGRRRGGVGDVAGIPKDVLERLSRAPAATVSGVIGGEAGRVQVVTAPVGKETERLGTIHALISIASVEALLASDDLDPSLRIYAVGPDARVLASSPDAPVRGTFERTLPSLGSVAVVEDYTTPEGDHVVGTAMRLERPDWTLAIEQDYEVAFAPVVNVIRQVLAINFGIVVVFGIIAGAIARSIVQPIHALSEVARRIAKGETDVEIPREQGQDEIGVLSRALHAMVDRLQSNQEELRRNQEQIERANADLTRANEDLHRNNEMLEQLSFTDGLTRLHNHRFFQERLRVEIKRADRNEEPLALLLLDIDDFKKLNDRYGHAAGDEVLRSVAAVLNETVRETDLPARYGGEEFAVLAPRTDAAGAVALGEKLRSEMAAERVRDPGIPEPKGLGVTVSIGVALYDGDPKRFFNEADRALYQAKDAGKDCVVLFEESASN
ncbi:MAG: diguanylate cyclase [Myxococcota bacterium]